MARALTQHEVVNRAVVTTHEFRERFALASLVAHHEHFVRCIALHGRHSGFHSRRRTAVRSLLGMRPPSEAWAVAQLVRPMAAFDLRSVSGPITVALGRCFPQEEAFLPPAGAPFGNAFETRPSGPRLVHLQPVPSAEAWRTRARGNRVTRPSGAGRNDRATVTERPS